jgi:hypothetical protein
MFEVEAVVKCPYCGFDGESKLLKIRSMLAGTFTFTNAPTATRSSGDK